ncbi:glycosyltransferase family 4 protein [Muricoccus radiodurans]|uniref:glycosyltransferase family 4 protein n=1 Tax=Muricoccus radiodurans TaxID=2231721 RepID=UPI003CF0EE7B
MAPRILIDGFNLALEHGTGVSTYARNLSYRLGAMGAEVDVLYGRHVNPDWPDLLREVAFFDDPAIERMTFRRRLRRFRRTVFAGMRERAAAIPVTGQVVTDVYTYRMPHFDRLWNIEDLFNRAHNRFKMRAQLLPVAVGRKPTVAHWTYPLALRIPGVPNIYTMHDLVPLRLPFTTLDHKRRYYRLCKMLVDQADHIVTVSEASRSDIINLLGAHPDRVTNTYQAVELPPHIATKPEDQARDEVRGAFGLEWGGYHLFFGAIEPKKNLARLIEAHLVSGVQTPLVILGKQAWKSEEELRLLKQQRVQERLVLLDYAPFRLLVSLIRGAKSVLFPSLYEGFGLPVLEAMSLGTPVLTSNNSSLPEVVGDAAVKVNPYDVRAMVEGIRALENDPELRDHLSHVGRQRAALFSGAAYERRLTELYARLGVTLGDEARGWEDHLAAPADAAQEYS